MFSCDKNRCISPDLICNGRNDCKDNSDEENPCQSKVPRNSTTWLKLNENIVFVVLLKFYFEIKITYFLIIEVETCKTKSNEVCKIPFEFKGQKYATCLDTDNDGIPWCYTNMTSMDWKACNLSTCSEWKGIICFVELRSSVL